MLRQLLRKLAGRETTTPSPASSLHRDQILASDCCGCFFCMSTFPPSDIEEWIDEIVEPNLPGQTALCPHCSVDAVIGSASGHAITMQFLKALHKQRFGNDNL